jgi:phosphatidylinositol alpha-mannosyltransferase
MIALGVSVLASAGFIAVAVVRIGPSRVVDSLAGVRAGWLLAAFVVMAISLVLRALAWQWVLRAAAPEVHVPTAVVVRAAMIGVMTSAVAPGRLGEPARALVVARHTGDTVRTLPVVLGTLVSQTVLNLIALAALAVASLASIRALHPGGGVLAVLAVPVGVALAVAAAPAALRVASRARLGRLRRTAAWAARQARAMRSGLRVFADPRHATLATVAQLSAWGLQLVAVDMVLRALRIDAHTGLSAAAAVLLAVNVSAAVPVTPGNVGVFQGACLVVLAVYGVGAGPALAFGIVLQALEIATAVALGVPALATEGLGWHELRERAAPLSDSAGAP